MENHKWDPEEFIVPAQGAAERSVRLCFQIPPLMNQVIDKIVNSGKFPFRTKDDAARWCLYHGVKALGSMDGSISILPVLEMMVFLARRQLHTKMFCEFFEKLDRVVVNLLATGFQEQQARGLVVTMSKLIMCITCGSERTHYFNELRQRWGHLLSDPECESQEDRNG